MKKFKIFAIILAVMCFSSICFSGCNFLSLGSNLSLDSSAKDTNKPYSSVEEFIKNPINQVAIHTIKGTISEGTKFNIKAEENKLVFEYKYSEVFSEESKESMASQLRASHETNSAAFSSLASSLEKEVDVTNPLVVVRYFNGDGTKIYEGTFAPA